MNRRRPPMEPEVRNSRSWSRKKAIFTILLAIPAVVVFTAADQATQILPCRALEMEVDQIDGMYFVDAPTLHALVSQQYPLFEKPISELPLGEIHATLMAQHGVADCQISPTLGGTLKIEVTQQRPLARVWTPDTVLYLDDKGQSLPLSPRYTAEVPIVHAADIEAAKAARPLLNLMDKSPFWNAFIDQIEVDDLGQISFRPRVADVVVELGTPDTLGHRLNLQLQQLRAFYSELIQRGDLRQYRTIRLQYDGQLIAAK